MCTVSVIRLEGGAFRVVTNRDEQRSRPPALRPTVVPLAGGGFAAWPTDALAGGTWVAAGGSGLVLALLNGNPGRRPWRGREGLASRGLIIPALIDRQVAARAAEALGSMTLERYAPFRLIGVDAREAVDAFWNGRTLRVERRGRGPLCAASSGLGDDRVRERVALFEMWMGERGMTPSAQDEFHRHRWAERPEISVMMSRAEARTISVTAVEVSGVDGVVTMNYRDDAGESVVNLSGAATMDTLRAEWARGRVQC